MDHICNEDMGLALIFWHSLRPIHVVVGISGSLLSTTCFTIHLHIFCSFKLALTISVMFQSFNCEVLEFLLYYWSYFLMQRRFIFGRKGERESRRDTACPALCTRVQDWATTEAKAGLVFRKLWMQPPASRSQASHGFKANWPKTFSPWGKCLKTTSGHRGPSPACVCVFHGIMKSWAHQHSIRKDNKRIPVAMEMFCILTVSI